MKKLFEFSAMVQCNAVIAAESEEEAREHIKTWERSWFETGELVGVFDVDLFSVRPVEEENIEDLAHSVA